MKEVNGKFKKTIVREVERLNYKDNNCEFQSRMSIPYRRPYRFGHRYDIFRIPVNTGVPFWVYRYFIYIYIYVCMYVCVCVYIYIYIIINIKVYHKTFPQFRTNYS